MLIAPWYQDLPYRYIYQKIVLAVNKTKEKSPFRLQKQCQFAYCE